MDSIPGDQYVGEYARWLRVHEAKLGDVAASAATAKRNAVKSGHDASSSTLSSTFWNVVSLGTAKTANTTTNSGFSPARPSSTSSAASTALAARPMLLRQNPHNLYYLLIRFEALGLPVGSLDTKIPVAARPTSYFSFVAASAAEKDRDDTMSMSSIRSRISIVSSSFSSSLSWFGTSAGKPDPSSDVKYIYSCFTKIPSLRLGPIPARKLVQDFEDCPGQSAVPLDVFKNLQMLELDDVDPRTLTGWDRICIQLRSLTCRKSNIEDLTDVLVDLVILDTKRKRGETVRSRRLRNVSASNTDANRDLAGMKTEPTGAKTSSSHEQASTVATSTPTLPKELPSLAWHFLRYLNLSHNNLTFVPVEPLLCLSGLTNLDLSSNLLNVVPPSLSHLPALTSLNISDNLIDSVLGIYDTIPAIRVLNLAKNRLESLCGLERLFTLQRIDLRGNAIYESGEVGRLAPLPAIAEVWVKDNPLVEELVDYRVDCFVEFAQEGRSVSLDGEAPGFFEKQRIAERVPNATALFAQLSSGRSRWLEPSKDGVSRADGEAEQEVEENEAQLAKDVATTSRNASVVKNVRHRAVHRAANADVNRGRSELLQVPSSDNSDSRADGTEHGRSRSRSTSRTGNSSRLQSGASASGPSSRRRNQRVVELDTSPQKPIASSSRERTLTDSDRIKEAALSGNNTAALESPDRAAASHISDGDELEAGASKSATLLKGKARAAAARSDAEDSQWMSEQVGTPTAGQENQTQAIPSDAEVFAAHGAMLFALPPGTASLQIDATSDPPKRAGQKHTFTSRRNPFDASTLGRKSAAQPMASDLFATSDNGSADATASDGPSSSGASQPGFAEAKVGSDDTPAALARQRIARPRTGSAAALARRSRVTTSLYDPDLYEQESSALSPRSQLSPGSAVARDTDATKSRSDLADGDSGMSAASPDQAGVMQPSNSHMSSINTAETNGNRSDAFRRRIEALKSEVGDDWLRLLAHGSGAAGDRNSTLLLSTVKEERTDGKPGQAGEGSEGRVEAVGEVNRAVRAKKHKKKVRTGTGEPSSLSGRTSLDQTADEGNSNATSGRRREARIT